MFPNVSNDHHVNKDSFKNVESEEQSQETSSVFTKEEERKWGYDLYPERRGNYQTTGVTAFMEGKGRENIDRIKCERSVYKCIKKSPLVKLMMGALKYSGCPIDIRRHISCEICDNRVTGGYDPVMNQVIICQNTAKSEGYIQGILTHEMIHMFDFCRNNLDFKNIDHLACTEIRAANLAHCSFLSSFAAGYTTPFNIKQTHQVCVKNKALTSLLAVRDITTEEAKEAIERVFPKCYPDLEPIGRRIRRHSADMWKAYHEGIYYGYNDES